MSDDPTKDSETPEYKQRFGLLGQLADCLERTYGLKFQRALTYVTATYAQLTGPALLIMLPGGQTISITGEMLVLADNPGGRFWHRCREHLLRPVVKEAGRALEVKTTMLPQTLNLKLEIAEKEFLEAEAELKKWDEKPGAKLQGMQGLDCYQ